jgi:hypothetical protein
MELSKEDIAEYEIIKAALLKEFERQEIEERIYLYQRDEQKQHFTVDGKVNMNALATAISEALRMPKLGNSDNT